MNAPKLYIPIRFGNVAQSATRYSRFYVEEASIIKAFQFFDEADLSAGTGTSAVSATLFNRGTDGTGTTVIARVTNDTTTYTAETATTKAAAITDELGIRKDLSSANAAVLAQGDGYLKISGTEVAAGVYLEVVVIVGSAATALVDAQATIVYSPGQN